MKEKNQNEQKEKRTWRNRDRQGIENVKKKHRYQIDKTLHT